jgi:hypothetical protein
MAKPTKTATRERAPQEPATGGALTVVHPKPIMGTMVPLNDLPIYLRGDTREDVDRVIGDIVEGGMVPRGFIKKDGAPNVPAMRIAIFNGRTLGYNQLYSIQNQCVINGIPRWYGDAPLARVWSSGMCEDIEEWLDESDPDNPIAHCRCWRRGKKTATERTFSWRDAENAGLTGKGGADGKSPWQAYWKRMLQFRARSFCLRDTFTEILSGMPIAEEFTDAAAFAQLVEGAVVSGDQAPPRPTRPEDQDRDRDDREAQQDRDDSPPPFSGAGATTILYPLIDPQGETVGDFPSGDWLDRAAEILRTATPDQHIQFKENNDATLMDLRAVLTPAKVQQFIPDKTPPRREPEREREASPAKPPRSRTTGGPPGSGQPDERAETSPRTGTVTNIEERREPAKETAKPEPAKAEPAKPADKPKPGKTPEAADESFVIANERGERVYLGIPGKYAPYVDWMVQRARKLEPPERAKLLEANATWLREAAKTDQMGEAAKKFLLPEG